jgi:mercuric ion transport protein
MAENTQVRQLSRETAKETTALLLALGGLAAAFGAASCCALPMLLAGAGLGSAWLIGVAVIAAPYRIAPLAAAAVCLVAGGAVFAWHRRTGVCGSCGHRMVTPVVMITMALASVLAALGIMYAE